ncbi:MAG: xanthine dehydrogenase family protein molybdopterin-binding subunit [Actinomycetota bacterium]|nr:xanthine dehydrogenase family protein molybdopterin-binding subunit [Actinomycetota bacterium]MDQ3568673.1 xanthine dehydrogenase family protein molybdopterin-binding subunit [Actinomycetota bacterium]
MTEAPERYVGGGVPRKEDPALVTGRANWTDNIKLPGMLHMSVLRSPFAHAKITHLDVSDALEQPGVVAAFTGNDLAELWKAPMPCAWPVTEDIKMPDHWPLAKDEANFMGDAVAVVIASDRYTAQDALEFIVVDYEPLEVVLNMEDALKEDAPLVHEDMGTNQSYVWPLETGDIEGAFEQADVVIKERYIQQRLIPNAIEPRAVVAYQEPANDGVTLYTATQVPHLVRMMLSLVTGVPDQKVRVVAPDVGGGFGSKLNFYVEEALATVIARKLGTPIKWVEDRSENYQATIHGRDQIQDIELAATSEGKILGLRVKLLADMGAYLQLVTPGIPVLGAFMYPGVYQFGAYSIEIKGVFTNKTPTDAYRGAGRPEAAYAIERIVDALARRLDMDPVEIRRKNFYEPFDEPTATPGGIQYDSLNLPMVLDRVLEMSDYEGLREEQKRRRDDNDPVQLGIGFSTYTEICGLAPSQVLASLRYGAPGWESSTVRMFGSGKVEVVTGTTPHGQGHVTSWSQIAADALGVTPDDVEVIHGDTATSPHGLDTYGSRSLPVGGVAVHLAANKVADKAKKIAAHMLEASEDDLEFEGGKFSVAGSPDQSVTIQDVAGAAFGGVNIPEDMEPGLTADYFYDPPNFVFPFGAHICVVEVDTETGKTRVRDYFAVDDCGPVINPIIVDGQVHGGIAQGIAQALYEEAVYDEDGMLITGSMVDYMIPGAPELPNYTLDRTVTPSPTNPMGVKGIGEAGTIGSPPAVINAVIDALEPLGVTSIDMPASPMRVWETIQAAQNGGDA